MMWLCAWTINHGQNNLTDHWLIHSGRHAVVDWVSEIIDTDDLHCWAVSQIVSASEPHWTTGDG